MRAISNAAQPPLRAECLPRARRSAAARGMTLCWLRVRAGELQCAHGRRRWAMLEPARTRAKRHAHAADDYGPLRCGGIIEQAAREFRRQKRNAAEAQCSMRYAIAYDADAPMQADIAADAERGRPGERRFRATGCHAAPRDCDAQVDLFRALPRQAVEDASTGTPPHDDEGPGIRKCRLEYQIEASVFRVQLVTIYKNAALPRLLSR